MSRGNKKRRWTHAYRTRRGKDCDAMVAKGASKFEQKKNCNARMRNIIDVRSWTEIADERLKTMRENGGYVTKLSANDGPASWPKPPSGASPDRHPATCIVPKRTKTPNGEIRPHIALTDPFPRTQSSEIVVLRTITTEPASKLVLGLESIDSIS